jgi:hypothetical protein
VQGTKLRNGASTRADRWAYTAYPGAGEATVRFLGGGPGVVERGERESVEDVEGNARRATRRAVSVSRRYIVANDLRYHLTLTFAEALQGRDGYREAMTRAAEHVSRWQRHVRRSFPYHLSAELHPGGHGWHVNVLVDERIDWSWHVENWRHGFVLKPKKWKGRGSGRRAGARSAAAYACKYITKAVAHFEAGHFAGLHRYEVGQGFQPIAVRRSFPTLGACERTLLTVMGGDLPDLRLDSSGWVEYRGPPLQWWAWN